MNYPALDIANRIESLSIELLCYTNEEPASPNNCVTIYDTGGSDPALPGELFLPTIQVRVRDLIYSDAYAKQEQIMLALCVPTEFEINGARYVGVWQQGDITSIGRDENNRYILTANYRIERHQL